MKKGVLTLALLVSVLVLVNTTFIFIIEQSRGGSFEERFAQTLTGYNQLEIFSKPVLEKYAPVEEPEKEITKTSDISNEDEVITTEETTSDEPEETTPTTVEQNQELLELPNGKEIILDFNRQVFIYDGREIPAIVDDVIGPNGEIVKDGFEKDSPPVSWVHLPYDRFDIYIEEEYYNNNTPEIDTFFDQFEPRYELMENTTGWSSEQFYGKKLKINVTGVAGGCYGGYAYPAQVLLILSDPLYMQGCGEGTIYNGTSQFGNPGELGDWWPYMGTILHENVHAINPFPIMYRSWLTEGFAEYNEYNILSEYGDINQETADYEIYEGTSGYNWQGYIANDYRDTTTFNREIQESPGYDITAWMFSMMRDDYSMDFSDFYDLLAENYDTLDEAIWDNQGNFTPYAIDMAVIDLFGRSVGYDSIGTKDIWEYDSPSGPGWGVRQWVDTLWYADLEPVLDFSKTEALPGELIQIDATINNYGEVDLTDVTVRFYNGAELIDEQTIDVPQSDSVVVSANFTSEVEGEFNITVKVDEDNVKIESNEDNNEDTEILVYSNPPYVCGDVDNTTTVNLLDILYMIDYKFKEGPAPLCDPITACADSDGNGKINLLDILHLIDYKFKSGEAPICS